jgi:hypothetical protein
MRATVEDVRTLAQTRDPDFMRRANMIRYLNEGSKTEAA